MDKDKKDQTGEEEERLYLKLSTCSVMLKQFSFLIKYSLCIRSVLVDYAFLIVKLPAEQTNTPTLYNSNVA